MQEVSAAATAILMAAEGVAGITCPWWLPWLFGSRWHGAWPLTACYAAAYVLLGQVNVVTGSLAAAGRPIGALRVWVWMALPWALGAALWMAFSSPVWLVSVLLGARTTGLLAAGSELRRAGVRARLARELSKCLLGAAAIVGGAAAAAAHRGLLVVGALLLLGAVEAVAVRDARAPLGALLAALRQQRGVELAH